MLSFAFAFGIESCSTWKEAAMFLCRHIEFRDFHPDIAALSERCGIKWDIRTKISFIIYFLMIRCYDILHTGPLKSFKIRMRCFCFSPQTSFLSYWARKPHQKLKRKNVMMHLYQSSTYCSLPTPTRRNELTTPKTETDLTSALTSASNRTDFLFCCWWRRENTKNDSSLFQRFKRKKERWWCVFPYADRSSQLSEFIARARGEMLNQCISNAWHSRFVLFPLLSTPTDDPPAQCHRICLMLF